MRRRSDRVRAEAGQQVVNWLESLGNWEEEMEKLDLDAAKRRTAAHKPLFSLS